MSADRAEVPGSRAERSTGDAAAEPPRISVVVPTRNRPEHAAACARSILRGDGFEELIFVDQSDEDATDKALSAISDARLRHVRSGLRGVTNGRNVGIDLSRGTVVAFTDDDCRVPPDWAHRIASVFSSDPGAAVVCGRVRVPDEIQERGFAVAFEPQVREWCHQFPPPESDWGITANMAIRREVLEEVGYFDPVLADLPASPGRLRTARPDQRPAPSPPGRCRLRARVPLRHPGIVQVPRRPATEDVRLALSRMTPAGGRHCDFPTKVVTP
jgi:glycosyltransferase involved in cell wall biosynthesis